MSGLHACMRTEWSVAHSRPHVKRQGATLCCLSLSFPDALACLSPSPPSRPPPLNAFPMMPYRSSLPQVIMFLTAEQLRQYAGLKSL